MATIGWVIFFLSEINPPFSANIISATLKDYFVMIGGSKGDQGLFWHEDHGLVVVGRIIMKTTTKLGGNYRGVCFSGSWSHFLKKKV